MIIRANGTATSTAVCRDLMSVRSLGGDKQYCTNYDYYNLYLPIHNNIVVMFRRYNNTVPNLCQLRVSEYRYKTVLKSKKYCKIIGLVEGVVSSVSALN